MLHADAKSNWTFTVQFKKAWHKNQGKISEFDTFTSIILLVHWHHATKLPLNFCVVVLQEQRILILYKGKFRILQIKGA